MASPACHMGVLQVGTTVDTTCRAPLCLCREWLCSGQCMPRPWQQQCQEFAPHAKIRGAKKVPTQAASFSYHWCDTNGRPKQDAFLAEESRVLALTVMLVWSSKAFSLHPAAGLNVYCWNSLQGQPKRHISTTSYSLSTTCHCQSPGSVGLPCSPQHT